MVRPQRDGAAPRRHSKAREWLLLALSILLLLAVVVPPLVHVSRFGRRISESMRSSLGRPVRARAVSARLLPAPALVLSDVEVEEDPAFGSEPALHAPTLVAYLRLLSLWRGQLEFSRVEISDASLNLARDNAGHWNLGSVLLQASRNPNTPTAQRSPGPAPRFPYIQITDARVNLKQGVEKLPYTLQNVNAALWLSEPDVWQLRIEAQPVRTDVVLGLSDTGLLRVEGSLHRATALGRMPLALHADWDHVPLGQASRLLLGTDRGWRGEAHLLADFSGDPDDLHLKTHLDLDEFAREDWTPSEPFAIHTTCTARYLRSLPGAGAGGGLDARAPAAPAAQPLPPLPLPRIDDLHCVWPVDGGSWQLGGSLALGGNAPAAGRLAGLTLAADHVAPSFFLAAASLLTRGGIPPGLHAEGPLSGSVSLGGTAPPAGAIEPAANALTAAQLTVALPNGEAPLPLADVALRLSSPSTITLTAHPLALGGDRPLSAELALSLSGYTLHATGGASLARAQSFGLPLPAGLAAAGRLELDLTRTGTWAHDPAAEAAPITAGSLTLHNARYTLPLSAQPVLLPTLQVTWQPGSVVWTAPRIMFAGMPLSFTAEAALPCAGVAPPCPVHFRASFAHLDAATLQSALREDAGGSLSPSLRQLLARWTHPGNASPQAPFATEGELRADTFTVGPLTLRNAAAVLDLRSGSSARMERLDAQTLGGRVHATGTVTLAGDGTPRYQLQATFSHVSAAAAGEVLGEDWGPGTLALTGDVTLAGRDAAALRSSAEGTLEVEWLHGALGPAAGPLTPLSRFARWTAEGSLGAQTFTLAHAQIWAGAEDPGVPIEGSVGLDRRLHLTVNGSVVEGSLARPVVSSSGEQAVR